MKRIFFTTLFLIVFCCAGFSQLKQEVAQVYFERAAQALDENKDAKAEEYFVKGEEILGGMVSSTNDTRLGAMLYFRLKKYEKAKAYVEQYFSLSPKRGTLEYKTMLEVYVSCEEKIAEQKELERQKEEERLRKEREKRRIDSLTQIWTQEAKKRSLIADKIHPFNKQGIALYELKGNFGIVDDKGAIIKVAENDKFGCNFDGYIVIANRKVAPTKIFVYDCLKKEVVKIPSISEIGPLTTNYGKVTLVRANGSLVLYPDRFSSLFIYNLKEQKRVETVEAEKKRILEQLEENKIIDRYKSDGRVRINDVWYHFGSYLGGGIVAMFGEKDENNLKGFFFSSRKKFVPVSELNYLGVFYDDKIQGFKGNKILWLNRTGDVIEESENKLHKYKGNSVVEKNDDKSFFIIDKESNKILKDGEEFPLLKEFLE
ncbi:MAG: hypothetical protein CSA94_01330 [Bacteroidetes bacterium]|nr:MAG: hypothetical protein CSA94_01330 [Bacteroidota bacterium]